jgi:fructokinase
MINNPIIVFGEVLFDQFSDGALVLGGAPFNVAWHLQAFGQQPQFISRVGDDMKGQQIRSTMQTWDMSLDFLQWDSALPTGVVEVAIDNGEPSYSILTEQAYDYIELPELYALNQGGILYHGTLATRSTLSKQTLTAIKARHQGQVFIDVNLRQPWWNKPDVRQLIDAADWVKLNLDEFRILHDGVSDPRFCMEQALIKSNLEGIIVTCGAEGALAVTNNGEFFSVAPTTSVKLEDTVGAGDAFSAIVLLGINLGWDFKLTMERAQLFASAITGQRGATINDVNFYKPFLTAWEL